MVFSVSDGAKILIFLEFLSSKGKKNNQRLKTMLKGKLSNE